MKCYNCKSEINYNDVCTSCATSQLGYIEAKFNSLSFEQLTYYVFNSQEYLSYLDYKSMIADCLVNFPDRLRLLDSAIDESKYNELRSIKNVKEGKKFINKELDDTFYDKNAYRALLESLISSITTLQVAETKPTIVEEVKAKVEEPKPVIEEVKVEVKQPEPAAESNVERTISDIFEEAWNKVQDPDKDEFQVILKKVGNNRAKTISLVQEISGVDIFKTQRILSNLPAILRKNVAKEEANVIKSRFADIGDSIVLE